jgi:hypothetical protein
VSSLILVKFRYIQRVAIEIYIYLENNTKMRTVQETLVEVHGTLPLLSRLEDGNCGVK